MAPLILDAANNIEEPFVVPASAKQTPPRTNHTHFHLHRPKNFQGTHFTLAEHEVGTFSDSTAPLRKQRCHIVAEMQRDALGSAGQIWKSAVHVKKRSATDIKPLQFEESLFIPLELTWVIESFCSSTSVCCCPYSLQVKHIFKLHMNCNPIRRIVYPALQQIQGLGPSVEIRFASCS